MTTEEFLEFMNNGNYCEGGSEAHLCMSRLSQEAIKITTEINSKYHEPEEIKALFEKLIGKKIDGGFGLFRLRQEYHARQGRVY